MTLRFGALLVLAITVLTAACASGGPAHSPDNSASVDCGAGRVSHAEELRDVGIVRQDVPSELSVESLQSVVLQELGDADFKSAVGTRSFIGGYTSLFASDDFVSTGRGRAVTSIIVGFSEQAAADLLFEHPYVGDPDVLHPAEVLQLGDRTEAVYYEVGVGPDKLTGYTLQFQVGRVVVYVGDVGTDPNPSLSEAEGLADLVCQRLR